MSDGPGAGLAISLGKALGRAHDIGWVDGLIGGDQDHAGGVGSLCGIGNIAGADNIGQHGIIRVAFHQRYMFQGRCMENHFRRRIGNG